MRFDIARHASLAKERVQNLTKKQWNALLVAGLVVTTSVTYSSAVIEGRIHPVISTWMLFCAASWLMLWTYMRAEESRRDWVTNISNTVSAVANPFVFAVILLFGKELNFTFTMFERVCFGLAGAILIFFLRTKDGKDANIALNVLMAVAYCPMFVHLARATHNTEGFIPWITSVAGSAVALYNPMKEKDLLPKIYCMRSIACGSIVIILMLRITLR